MSHSSGWGGVAAVTSNQTRCRKYMIYESLSQHFHLINQSKVENSLILKDKPRLCNFMILYVLYGWVCSSSDKLIHPWVVTGEGKLVPHYWMMMALETLKMSSGLSDGKDVCKVWWLQCFLLSHLYLFNVRNTNLKEGERNTIIIISKK